MKSTRAVRSLLQIVCIFCLTTAIPGTCCAGVVAAQVNGNSIFLPGPFQQASSGSVSTSSDYTLFFGSISSRARAWFGGLGVYSAAQYNGASGGDPVQGSAQAYFQDDFTINAPGLSGQSGSMTFKLKVAGSLAATSTRTAGVGAAATAIAQLTVLSPVGGETFFQGSESIESGATTNRVTGKPFLNREVLVVVPFTFGVQRFIKVQIYASSVASYDPGHQTSSTVDMGNTLEWGGVISVTDSGGNAVTNYTTATGSGTDYSAPILDLPRLTLVPLNPGQLQLSWSTNYPAFTLESSTSLSNDWQTVTNSTGISAEQHTLTVVASSTNQFYRLRKN